MSMNAQTLEILGWLFITLFLTLPAIFVTLSKSDRMFYLSSYGAPFFGFLIGSLLLYYSRTYGIYAFSFLIFWIVRVVITIVSLTKESELLTGIWLVLSDFLFLILFILFGTYYQTEIWFITATLVTFVNILGFMNVIYFEKPTQKLLSSEFDPKKYFTGFLPALVLPFASFLYIFDIGVLDAATLHTFYGTLIGGFFALLGIVAMFGVFILERFKDNRDYLSKLFKGLILLYVIATLVLTLGLITLPKNSEEIALDLSHNTLIPDSPLEERQLPDTGQIFGLIIFTASISFLISSLAYLYKIVSEILKSGFVFNEGL
jgi:hypothetical protein